MNANFKLEEKIETYGAVFNIDYASKVLKLYCDKRYRLDHKLIEVDRHIQVEKKLAEEANIRRGKIKAAYDKFWLDDNADIDYTDFYMQLDEDNAFASTRTFELFLKKAEEALPMVETGNEHMGGHLNRLYPFKRNLDLEYTAQKLCVKYLFKNMKLTKKEKIYGDALNLLWPGFVISDKRPESTLPF